MKNTANSELLAALENTARMITTAREYFPKSIRNPDRFRLESLCAQVNRAIENAKAQDDPTGTGASIERAFNMPGEVGTFATGADEKGGE